MAGFLNFTKALATNRLGIVLAALNLCYFTWDGFSVLSSLPGNFDKIMIAQNSPAIILTIFSTETMEFLFSKPLTSVYHPFGLTVFLFLVALQWLFIGWAAKTIARKIR
jgi:hypothetical protein